jgi:hypothetical protein
MDKRGKKGQLQLSFGMIFSIILIIAFLGFGFYAIMKFIDLQNSIQIENFLRDFQQDIDKMWKSSQGSQTIKYPLPSKISAVCFKNDEFQNLEFISNSMIKGDLIENIDIAEITEKENPYCIQNVKGKISITLIKDYGETLVRVER